MQAKNIDEVITYLEIIINQSKNEEDTLGYFAALYYQVTVTVKTGIANNYFHDGGRMEQFDVLFANRYLDAYAQFKQNGDCTESWRYAFLTAKKSWPIVLQNLLLGMNAHINLDLGIVAAQLCPGEGIYALKEDFDKINSILSGLVADVEKRMTAIWPRLHHLLKLVGKADSFFIDFSMRCARDGAWKFATEFALAEQANHDNTIQIRDEKIARIARLISKPGFGVSCILLIIRIGEIGSVSKKIDQLWSRNIL
jgi:hypothetical protein